MSWMPILMQTSRNTLSFNFLVSIMTLEGEETVTPFVSAFQRQCPNNAINMKLKMLDVKIKTIQNATPCQN